MDGRPEVSRRKGAVPAGPDGKPAHVPGIYHEKVGIITDCEDNRLSFSGSINETAGGWVNNRESFHVHCSWEGEREAQHVADEVQAFDRLWSKHSPSTLVYDFPEAALKRLLEFLPKDDRFITPPGEHKQPESMQSEQHDGFRLLPEDIRRVVWTYIHNAARMWNGVRVGEVTSAVHPWPHQIRSYVRMLGHWPCRLLISDEVGLGKTISAGLAIRQAWLSGMSKRILLIVPAGVLLQWQNELYEKFNLDVPIYDGHKLTWKQTHGRPGSVERKVGRTEWQSEPIVLCSSHLMRRRDRVRELLEADPWDLVVLDEAHHARRRGAGTAQESGPNQLLRLMRDFRSRTKASAAADCDADAGTPRRTLGSARPAWAPRGLEWQQRSISPILRVDQWQSSQADMEFLSAMFRATEAAFGQVDEAAVANVTPKLSSITRRKILKALRDSSGIPLKAAGHAES